MLHKTLQVQLICFNQGSYTHAPSVNEGVKVVSCLVYKTYGSTSVTSTPVGVDEESITDKSNGYIKMTLGQFNTLISKQVTISGSDGYIQTTGFSYKNQLGFKLASSGEAWFNKIHANSGEFTGTIHATDGEFSGELKSAKGIFNGTLTQGLEYYIFARIVITENVLKVESRYLDMSFKYEATYDSGIYTINFGTRNYWALYGNPYIINGYAYENDRKNPVLISCVSSYVGVSGYPAYSYLTLICVDNSTDAYRRPYNADFLIICAKAS